MMNPITAFYSLIFIAALAAIGFVVWWIYTHGICGIPWISNWIAWFYTCKRPATAISQSELSGMQISADIAIQRGYGPTGAVPWALTNGVTGGTPAYCSLGFGGLFGYFNFPSGTSPPYPPCVKPDSGGNVAGVTDSTLMGAGQPLSPAWT